MIELIIAIPILCGVILYRYKIMPNITLKDIRCVINGRYKEPINNLEKIDKRRSFKRRRKILNTI